MIIIRVSPNKILLVNEYWVLIPLIAVIYIRIVLLVRKNRAEKKRQLEQWKNDYRRKKIFSLAMGDSISALNSRGGEVIVQTLIGGYEDVLHPECIVAKGIRYVNNEQIRQIIFLLYPDKVKNGVIFITQTALCHLVSQFGAELLALPGVVVAAPNIVKVSSWLLTGKKALASVLFLSPIVILGIWGLANSAIILSVVSFLSGITGMALTKDAGLTIIGTSAFSGPISLIRRRVEDRPEVVSMDFEPASNKLTMSESSGAYPYECSLPEQRLGNPTCARENKIIEMIKNSESGNLVLDKVIEYNEVVNMEDVTGLTGKEFSDQFELLPVEKPPVNDPKSITPNLRKSSKSRTADLLKKYGDPKNIPDAETWDTIHGPGTQKDAIRIRNNEL